MAIRANEAANIAAVRRKARRPLPRLQRPPKRRRQRLTLRVSRRLRKKERAITRTGVTRTTPTSKTDRD